MQAVAIVDFSAVELFVSVEKISPRRIALKHLHIAKLIVIVERLLADIGHSRFRGFGQELELSLKNLVVLLNGICIKLLLQRFLVIFSEVFVLVRGLYFVVADGSVGVGNFISFKRPAIENDFKELSPVAAKR